MPPATTMQWAVSSRNKTESRRQFAHQSSAQLVPLANTTPAAAATLNCFPACPLPSCTAHPSCCPQACLVQVQVDADGTPVTISGWVSKATANSGRAAGVRWGKAELRAHASARPDYNPRNGGQDGVLPRGWMACKQSPAFTLMLAVLIFYHPLSCLSCRRPPVLLPQRPPSRPAKSHQGAERVLPSAVQPRGCRLQAHGGGGLSVRKGAGRSGLGSTCELA